MSRRLPRPVRIAAAVAALLVAAYVAVGAWRPRWVLDAYIALIWWRAGAEVREVEAAGHRIVYAEAGRGDTLVLLHGFTGAKENWQPVVGPLSRDFRVVVPDLPGWNASERLRGADYGYAAQAERVAAFIDAVSERPVHLVGHSMGGGIAAVLAARHSDRLAHLVLMDAGGVRFRDNAFGRDVLRGGNPFAVHDRASFRDYLDAVFVDPPLVPWPLDTAMIEQRAHSRAFEDTVLDAIGRGPDAFLPGRLAAQIDVPTTLVWCRGDRIIDPSAAMIYADAIGLETDAIVWLEGCNHMPMMERPDPTVDVLRRALPASGSP